MNLWHNNLEGSFLSFCDVFNIYLQYMFFLISVNFEIFQLEIFLSVRTACTVHCLLDSTVCTAYQFMYCLLLVHCLTAKPYALLYCRLSVAV